MAAERIPNSLIQHTYVLNTFYKTEATLKYNKFDSKRLVLHS